MARIQILELPSERVGEFYRTPFSIIIDQCESGEVRSHSGEILRTATSDLTQAQADHIARSMGAVSAVLVACRLDVV